MAFDKAHALVIGVGLYQYMPQYNVPIAGVDAAEVVATLQNEKLCAYLPEQVKLLTNQDATRQGLLDALNKLAGKLTEENTLFLFFVGHGVYGTDGNYYLTTHDTKLAGNKVVPGTGISESELLEALRKVKAKRLMVVINACHSGALSPDSLGIDEDSLGSETPPEKLTTALLATGEGRIVITACRPEQKSWIGNGKLSIFSDALVRGLKGSAPNRNGYISAYGLYEYIFEEVKEAVAEMKQIQEAELTVIKGVGPFPVALHHGAVPSANFNADEPVPASARVISEAKSQRYLGQYNAMLIGNGAIAQGPGAKAAGAGGMIIDGNVSGNITIGNNNRINSK